MVFVIITRPESNIECCQNLVRNAQTLDIKKYNQIDLGFYFILVICVHINLVTGEIYKTVISVYSNDEHSPLPQADEVLICTSNTTLDMVGILNLQIFIFFISQ